MSSEREIAENGSEPKKRRRGRLRLAGIILLGLAGVLLLLAAIVFFAFKSGFADSYIKNQFVETLASMGVTFRAEKFALQATPLALELENAEFYNSKTRQPLASIKKGRIEFTITDLFAWRLTREIRVESTELNGAQFWIIFDENGRSNFADIVQTSGPSRINLKYESAAVKVINSAIHFGDGQRAISFDAENVSADIAPAVDDSLFEEPRYQINIAGLSATAVYETRRTENIDFTIRAVADSRGADIQDLRVDSPLGSAVLSGKISNWQSFEYDLNLDGSLDLAKTGYFLGLEAAVGGDGTFKGKLKGQGEDFRIEAELGSQKLILDNILVKNLGSNISATIRGAEYAAQGKAFADNLSYENFQISSPAIIGSIKGKGVDFNWLGQMQAAAVKAGAVSIVGLLLQDAAAEARQNEINARARYSISKILKISESQFDNLRVSDLKLALKSGGILLTAPTASSDSFKVAGLRLANIVGKELALRNKDGQTSLISPVVAAESGVISNAKISNLKASNFRLFDSSIFGFNIEKLTADSISTGENSISDAVAKNVSLRDLGNVVELFSDNAQLGKINANGALLADVNISGIRIKILDGRIEGLSDDIQAGDAVIAQSSTFPEGGLLQSLRIAKPRFVVEPIGSYRISSDMSIGGGFIARIPLGSASSKVIITNRGIELNDLNGEVLDGSISGSAYIAFSERQTSKIDVRFDNLELSKIITASGMPAIALDGKAAGDVKLEFPGTNYKQLSGSLNARLQPPSSPSPDKTPISGSITASADKGLIKIEPSKINTAETELSASGQFDLNGNSSRLSLSLDSRSAEEVERLFRLSGLSPDTVRQLDNLALETKGKLRISGLVESDAAGNNFNGVAELEQISLRNRQLGKVRTRISASPTRIKLDEGLLEETLGGKVEFTAEIPFYEKNKINVEAKLFGADLANLVAAMPLSLPERIRDISGKVTGEFAVSGLPEQPVGTLDLTTTNGILNGEKFESLTAKADFASDEVRIQKLSMSFPTGSAGVTGSYRISTGEAALDVKADSMPLGILLSVLPKSDAIPGISGLVTLTGSVSGAFNDPRSLNITFNGKADDVVINNNPFGEITFDGNTSNKKFTAKIVADLQGNRQIILSEADLSNEGLPFKVSTDFNNSPLAPFFSLIPQVKGLSLGGNGTGRIEFGGLLYPLGQDGNRHFTASALSGSAKFSTLTLQIQDTSISSLEPVEISFSPSAIEFISARFAGSGSNLTLIGRKALTEEGINNLALDGKINLALLNIFPQVRSSDTFFGGFANASVRLNGPNSSSRLAGTATLENASLAAFFGRSRLSFDRLEGTIRFASNQAQFENVTGYLGGGKFTAEGGAIFGENLTLDAFRIGLNGSNVTVPLPADFITTGDANLEFTGRQINSGLAVQISGRIRASKSIYTKDIELVNLIGSRRETSLSSGPTAFAAQIFDLTIEGKDALIVKNNIADLTASVQLRLTGTAENPQLSGRITADSGTIFFRKDRYIVQRGVLEFPPDTAIDPRINLQAETEINGYQIFVILSGLLSDTSSLNASVRSVPALPVQDVLSLITTGSLSNTESGLPAVATTGINTAAEVLTDAIINNPARKATDRLFGLNIFEIDPILSGERLNPSARLTVGRQINNNLRVTYATNLSQDQNQVIALEYRLSNKLSVVAQYEQKALSNVTRNRDNFSIEVRLRKRF